MNWQSFKSLYELYEFGKTKFKPTLGDDAVFKYHAYQTKELLITRKEILVVDTASNSFKEAFEKRYLQTYNDCIVLLDSIDENTPQCKFEVDDIMRLKEMKTQMINGALLKIREQIIESKETRRGVSLMFFKNEKHLDGSEALERAVKKILDVKDFADDRDFQYLYVLECYEPKCIVLCENLYFLKMPEIPRENNIELWYAGGRNIDKLRYSNDRGLPIYYVCDWDYDGLDIFRLVKQKLPNIQLLTPNGGPRDIIKTEHKSRWKNLENPPLLSGLDHNLFSELQRKVIEKLIKEDCWIVEESNNLLDMIRNFNTY